MSGSLREEIKFQSRKAEIIGNSMKCKIDETQISSTCFSMQGRKRNNSQSKR